jgi:glycosyltransferase involved in cell wall biosynthesis
MALRGFCLFASSLRAIARLRASFDFDLIDAHFAYPDGFAAVLLGLWFRRPVCITLRGTIIMLSRRPLGRRLCDWAIRRAERVIAVADTLGERARQGGVPDSLIEVITNGIDGERFHPVDRTDARRRLLLPPEGKMLLSVGHLSARKGFQRVIRSLPRILRSRPDARLAIVGGPGAEGNIGAELEALVRQLGLGDHVQMVGPKPPDEVALWLGAADAFVLASDFEGCPNVILEAMACGRPVVATKVGDIARMVPQEAGILFDDPDDTVALAECVVAALSRQWDAGAIREQVATRSWDGVALRVAAQWALAVEAFRSRQAEAGDTSSQARPTAVSHSREL